MLTLGINVEPPPVASTQVNVPEEVNVWIVFPPEVVTVPPVEDVDTPSEPSVA